MKKEILNYIRENNLSPWNQTKTNVGGSENSIYKTKDAKIVHNKVISTLSSTFHFSDTSNIFNFFDFTNDYDEIKKRQAFFAQIKDKIDGTFLGKIEVPKRWWKPKYGIMVVTEDERTFNELKKINCPTRFLITPSDLESLEEYDIVQVIDCENFSRALESLPQSVFIDSIDEVYLERYVQMLSGWTNNLQILRENKTNEEIDRIVNELEELIPLLDEKSSTLITRESIDAALSKINQEVSNEVKNLTISGESFFSMLSKNAFPDELMQISKKAIKSSGLPENLFNRAIPVSVDEVELEKFIRKQSAEEHTGTSEKIKKKAQGLKKLPDKLIELQENLLLFDFLSGLSVFIHNNSFPEESSEFIMASSSNLFLDKAQPISFSLNDNNRCSILTGANSGGKTTLLEHIIQIISLFQFGLPISGRVSAPIFSEVYYFAKNKGSLNKGAFETLLTQMSKINPGKKTLILADEIESVTEPGVAGAIVCASADFFIRKGCFLVIATHLGKEIQKNLPLNARVDGIEAKGLDEFYELIVDHNPVLGRLANSTPELIIEKMANSYKTDYFIHLYDSVRKNK